MRCSRGIRIRAAEKNSPHPLTCCYRAEGLFFHFTPRAARFGPRRNIVPRPRIRPSCKSPGPEVARITQFWSEWGGARHLLVYDSRLGGLKSERHSPTVFAALGQQLEAEIVSNEIFFARAAATLTGRSADPRVGSATIATARNALGRPIATGHDDFVAELRRLLTRLRDDPLKHDTATARNGPLWSAASCSARVKAPTAIVRAQPVAGVLEVGER